MSEELGVSLGWLGTPSDWIETEVGFIRASEIAAVIIVSDSYEVERPSKGYSETHDFERLVIVTIGGARISVRESTYSDVVLADAKRIVEQVDALLNPVVTDETKF